MIGPRKVDKPLVLYGYGKLGRLAEEIFKELKIPIYAIIDCHTTFLQKSDVKMENCLVAVCVATEPYSALISYIKAIGFTDVVSVWDIIETYPEVGIHNGWMTPWNETTFEEEDECDIVMSKFCDKLSKIHYERNHLGWRRIHYELPDIEITPTLSLPSTLADIRARQRVEIFADAPMKTISIHSEGCELLTIQANMRLFKKYRPEIDVAVYHSRDGLYLIQKTLMDSLPDYRWTFRLTAFMGQGAYISGIPEEKI